MDFVAYLLLILAILLGVVGQLLLKQGMSKRPGFRVNELLSLIGDYSVISGFLCYGFSTLLYVSILARIELSLAYPTVSLGYVFVVIFSKLIFNETISSRRWIALAIISTGVILVGFGGN